MVHILLASVLIIGCQDAEDIEDTYPPLSDSMRFPSYEVALYNRNIASEHLKWLEEMANIYRSHSWNYNQAIGYARFSKNIWDQVMEAQDEDYSPSHRRYQLNELRALMGEEAYYAVKLPPPIPIANWQR